MGDASRVNRRLEPLHRNSPAKTLRGPGHVDRFSTASVAEAGSLLLCISPDYGCRLLTPVAFRGRPSVACVHHRKLWVDPMQDEAGVRELA